jgi:hypothetical protein
MLPFSIEFLFALYLINKLQLNGASGSGKLSWANEDGTSTIDIREGDVGSLTEGSVFYIHNNLDAQRKKLRIYAMFTNTDDSTFVSFLHVYYFLKLKFQSLVCLQLFMLMKIAGSINWCLLENQ